MSGYLPAGASQEAMDRLLDDEDPNMEWDSTARRWIQAGTDDASEEEQESELESPRKPVVAAQESLSELPRSATETR
jgi:hypothetical protein